MNQEILIVLLLSIVLYIFFFRQRFITSEHMHNTELHTSDDYNIIN
jgi:hypothetical protein